MKTEICVPGAALTDAGETGEGVAPAVGDSVEFSGRGTVSRVEGDKTWLELSEVNGQPVAGDMPGEPDADAAMDAEMEGLQRGGYGGGAGMVAAWIVLALALWAFGSMKAMGADLRLFTDRVCSGGAVSNYVATTNLFQQGQYAQVSSIEINNFSGSTLYLMIFDSATNNPANATPHFTAVPVPSGSVGGKDFGASGARFLYGVNVCLSTTPFSLTNASSGGTATIIFTKSTE